VPYIVFCDEKCFPGCACGNKKFDIVHMANHHKSHELQVLTRALTLSTAYNNAERSIDGFHVTFYHGNWRALHHHAACWLANIHITRPFALQLP